MGYDLGPQKADCILKHIPSVLCHPHEYRVCHTTEHHFNTSRSGREGKCHVVVWVDKYMRMYVFITTVGLAEML